MTRGLAASFAALLLLVSPATSMATCPSAISAINVVEGAAAILVVQRNQNCAPVSTTTITTVGGLPCPANAVNFAAASPTRVAVEPDPSGVGIDFSAVPGATGMAACTVSLNHVDGSNSIGSPLSVTLSDGTTSTSLTSQ